MNDNTVIIRQPITKALKKTSFRNWNMISRISITELDFIVIYGPISTPTFNFIAHNFSGLPTQKDQVSLWNL